MFLASADSAVESNSKNCNGASNLQGSSNALEDSYSDIGQHNILSVAGKYYFVLTLPLYIMHSKFAAICISRIPVQYELKC